METKIETIKVKVEFLGYLSQVVKESKDEFRVNESFQGAVRQIYELVGFDKQSLNHILLVNGVNYALFKESETKLQKGDILSFVPIVSGVNGAWG